VPKIIEHKDPLASEVSIRAHIDHSGLTVAGKSRALAAFDRLLGAFADLPTAFLERLTARSRAQASVDIRLIEAEGEAAKQTLLSEKAFGERIVGRFINIEGKRQENVERITVQASEQLALLPAPEDTENDENENSDIDEDWLNSFRRHAEDASSERMQKLWARILSDEVSKPGSFSKVTMRLLAEIDRDIAETYRSMSDHIISHTIYHPKSWKSGAIYDSTQRLKASGLTISHAGETLSNSLPNDAGNIIIGGDRLGAIIFSPDSPISFNVIGLSRSGIEMKNLLREIDEMKNFERLVDLLAETPAQRLSVGKKVILPGGKKYVVQDAVEIWRRS
jgi:hypothetical protein